jgi:hypothetical protein
MGKQFAEIPERLIRFIGEQKIFFVGTATADSRVNVSPKGMDAFRVLGPKRAIWLNVTGSGNETSAHVQVDPRMTVMFCAFQGPPLILRLYGRARVVHRADADWGELFARFEPIPGARQIFDLDVELVQTSCGMAVPYYGWEGDRDLLRDWAAEKGDDGLADYWAEKNQVSLDGLPTHVVARSRGTGGG